ncbi:MAG: insulinase family protein [Thermomonas sp.]|uniref:M16 family metallopeptidase n=2 Tax=Thermomonas sp. TaxID=1971895 RepID=UPI0025CF7460|nr:pitrilysin family protein [Thermomonas sp.]MBK6925895.1 insulinase family protein [Thermomonas sp.]
MSLFRPAALALALATALSAGAYVAPLQAANAPSVDIPHDSFTLPNGLRVVVHTDRKAPVVAVNIWYHVGSKDEPSGRSGFAHLFEHLMFNGSENNPGEFFAPFKQVGVTDQNGTTNTDRTNYFQNVPTTALDMALWMESDRMGHLLGAVDQATLDEQRGVVQNEKRQGMNQPYGQLREVTTYTLYPKGHPYHHSVIGSMNDLNAAKLADVQAWFKTWYGPNNAVLVLAGDIDLATAREKVTRYFGHIPASPTMAQPKVDVAVLEQDGRTVLEDKVPQVMVRRMWNVPQTGTRDADMLDLFSDVLGGSASSRLDRRLVHQDKLVDSIGTANWASQLGGNFMVNAMVKQGVDPAKVEAAIDEELKKLIAEGPTAEELARAKTSYEAAFVRGVERIGGFGGKADVLASCAIYERNPGCFRDSLQAVAGATPAQVRDAAAKWLGKPSHVFMVKPGARKELAEAPAGTPSPFVLPKVDARYKTTASSVDRSKGVPVTASFPDLKFPAQQRATLSNGTTVILAERHDVPVVQMSYQFAGGYSADPAGKPGIANFTASLLDEGAGDLDALGFAARKEALGAQLGAGASLDGNNAILSALKKHLEPSVALFADMLRKPRFDQAQVDRVKGEWIASIRQEKAQPSGVALRVLPALMYGAGHPYGNPLSGTGTEAAIAALTRDDLVAFHQRMMQPAGATLVVVGDTTLAEIVPLLEKHLGSWKVGSAGGAPAIPAVANARQSRVFLIDQPGAVQANIFAAQLVPSSKDPGAIAFDMANQVFGGDFTARLNMNLREDKHWSYGARSGAASAVGQRMWRATAPVQIDKAGESVAEIRREIAEFFGGSRGTSAEELARQQKGLTLSLPGAYETAGSVLATIGSNVLYGRPDDYVFRRKAEIEAITPAQVDAAAKTLDPGAITWVVVGDLAKTEAPIRALKLGEVTILDAEGKPVSK